MAITIIKQPAKFFNCTNPAIFEFTTDSEEGNFDDYVCDVIIRSLYTNKTAIIRNVFPNTATKVFSVDASEFFKALQLNGYEFDFNGSKNLAVEKFETSLKVRDGSIPDEDIFKFDSYIFDNFVFTDGLSTVDSVTGEYYSILGERLLFDNFVNPLTPSQILFLTPETIEICRGFDNYVSIFVDELPSTTVTVGTLTESVTNADGVATFKFTDAQLNLIRSLTTVEARNVMQLNTCKAYDFKEVNDKIVQFRFPNPKGGFSFFYSCIDSNNADRSKVGFYDKSYFNENENKSGAVQSGAEYKNELSFKGSKIRELKELFDMLLRAPKVEMNLKQINGNDVFIECEVTGSQASLYRSFDYTLKAKITNTGNFKL